MTDIRGKDDIRGIRYDPKSGEVLSRCSSCNIYKKREDFVSSLFCACEQCQRDARQFQETRNAENSASIHDYVGPGRRREFDRVIWRALKQHVAPVSGSKSQSGKSGRPRTNAVRFATMSAFLTNHPVMKKHRKALLSLIANNTMLPGQLIWLALKPGVVPKRLLRLWALDTAREVVKLSDLDSIVSVSYFFDDAENILRNPGTPSAEREAQRDLRNRVAQVAKVLTQPEHRTGRFDASWEAYDALLASIHPGSLRAAESASFYLVKALTRDFKWHPERALRKLLQLLVSLLESTSGIASDARKVEIEVAARHAVEAQAGKYKEKTPDIAGSYWVSCDPIYPDDRYLTQIGEDEKNVTMVVFWNPKNELEIGRKFKVLKEHLQPGPEGYVEVDAEELKSQGVELP